LAAATGFPGTDAVEAEAGLGVTGLTGFPVEGAEDGDLFSSGIAQNAPTSGEPVSERTITFISLEKRCQRVKLQRRERLTVN
jgi:hypothetical protein